MGDEQGGKPGRLAELLVERFERILGPDIQVKSPERIRGRLSGRRREVDVTLRRRMGATDVLVAIECRGRKNPQDVRWIEELASKKADVGAHAMVAVSTSGFTEAARRSADAHGLLLRELTQIGADEIGRWFLRTQLSVPRWRLFGAVVHTGDPRLPEFFIAPEDEETVFLISPAETPRHLRLLYEPLVGALLAGAAVNVPHGAKDYPVELKVTPDSDAATVTTRDGTTFPLAAVDVLFIFWMEPLLHDEVDARQYADAEGVLAQTSTYHFPRPDGLFTLEVTETPLEGEKYLFRHQPEGKVPDPPAPNKRTR